MREFVQAQERLKRAFFRQKHVNAQYEDARARAEEAIIGYEDARARTEEAIIENEFMRVRKKEFEEEKVRYLDFITRLRRKFL